MEINESLAGVDGKYSNDSDDGLFPNTIKHANLQLERPFGLPEAVNYNRFPAVSSKPRDNHVIGDTGNMCGIVHGQDGVQRGGDKLSQKYNSSQGVPAGN